MRSPSLRFFASYITRKNYYEILGVSSSSSKDQIKDAFLTKTRELHPDQARNKKRDSRVGWSMMSDTEQFMLVKEAYDVLRNDEKRKEYDEARSAEGGFLMEATAKTREMSTSKRNRERAEWNMDVVPNSRRAKNSVASHFQNPEDEYNREKRKNRMLVVLGGVLLSLVAANILYVRKLQTDRILEK